MINNLEAYKVFYYVAKCGSVTKAAGELSISQPAVSQAIKQLENTLDAALFHRAAKGVRLTSEGELLYSYVAKGYEQIEMGVKKVHQMQTGRSPHRCQRYDIAVLSASLSGKVP